MLWRIASFANGDARAAYNAGTVRKECTAENSETPGKKTSSWDARVSRITEELLENVLRQKMLRYDEG